MVRGVGWFQESLGRFQEREGFRERRRGVRRRGLGRGGLRGFLGRFYGERGV